MSRILECTVTAACVAFLQGLVKLFASSAELGLPAASAAAAQKWVTAAQHMMQQWSGFTEDFTARLSVCEQATETSVQTGFHDLEQQASELLN